MGHDLAISERRFFGKAEDPVRETVAPTRKALFQSYGTFFWPNLTDTESNLRNRHRRQGEFGVEAN